MSMNEWFDSVGSWQPELRELRRIALACDLDETRKWRQPCYTSDGHNIVILGVRKEHCVMSFFRGALLDDPDGLLEDIGSNSRAGKVLRFRDVDSILAAEPAIQSWIVGAVEVARAGLRVEPLTTEPEWVPELLQRLDEDPRFRAAWEGLTPGRRRGYHLHFEQTKRPATRLDRIDRHTARILAGKGIHDCVCGQSKRFPRCDGSHRYLT